VVRLREGDTQSSFDLVMAEAADEIERLREELDVVGGTLLPDAECREQMQEAYAKDLKAEVERMREERDDFRHRWIRSLSA